MAKTIIPKGALPPLGDLTDGALDRTEDGDLLLAASPPSGEFRIHTQTPFLRRLWFLFTNPIIYLFAGRIRW